MRTRRCGLANSVAADGNVLECRCLYQVEKDCRREMKNETSFVLNLKKRGRKYVSKDQMSII